MEIAYTIKEYAELNFNGVKTDIDRTASNQVYRWERKGYVIIDGWLYSKVRKIDSVKKE